jgi:hypothetical protein
MVDDNSSNNDDQVMTEEEREEKERQKSITERNFEILDELEHREITIQSNRYEEEDREYYVEEVERTYLDGSNGYIPSVRLVNSGVRKSLQPIIRVPRDLIPIEEEDDRRVLHLVYSSDPSVEHSFHFMNRYERPDLEIYISYEP